MSTKPSDKLASPIQEALFIESFESAVYAVASRVGGMKSLALSIWPAKGESAERWLSDCLNPDRSAKLSPEEVFQIIRVGRECGVHTVMYFIAEITHYTRPQPTEPEDERAALQRAYIESVRAQRQIADRLEKLGAA
jgi:hypothetical protein